MRLPRLQSHLLKVTGLHHERQSLVRGWCSSLLLRPSRCAKSSSEYHSPCTDVPCAAEHNGASQHRFHDTNRKIAAVSPQLAQQGSLLTQLQQASCSTEQRHVFNLSALACAKSLPAACRAAHSLRSIDGDRRL